MRHLLFGLLLSVLFLAAASLLPYARAESGDNVTGYAWSDTIGWISFNCENDDSCGKVSYGTNIAVTGEVSGYAWSDAIGWISFNAEELSGCPSAPCEARFSSNRLFGWARALSGIDNEEWDGWIRLGGASYAPILEGDRFSGYAWGSEVIGWVSFSRVRVKHNVAASLSSNLSQITQGEKLTLSWKSDNARACRSTQFDTKGATSGSATLSPLSAATFTVTCEGIGGSAQAQVAVGIHPASPRFSAEPATINEGDRSALSWSCPYATGSSGGGFSTGGAISGTTSIAPATTTSYLLQCHPNGKEVTATVEVLHPRLALSLRPALIRPGDTPMILWSASLVNKGSCTLTGPDVYLVGESGSSVLPPVHTQSTYVLSCTTPGGTISTNATANLIPNFR